MDPKEWTKQTLEFHKMTYENGYNTMLLMQEQAEKMMRAVMDQSPYIPTEGKRLVDEWLTACKKSRDEMKTVMDEGFRKVSDYLAGL